MQQLFKLILSYYLINHVQSSPKTSAETGNDIENFLMTQNSVKELSPKPREMDNTKKPDKFMEDLIEVQRTYRSLKEKWHRMMDEKKRVIQAASSTTPSTSSTTTSSEIQEIDVDVFEAPHKFQDISNDSEFDDESFVDISATSSVTTLPKTTIEVENELEQIQMAIREAFGGGVKKIGLSEIISPQKQMDAVITTMKVDQTTPNPTVIQNTTEIVHETTRSYGPIMLNANRHAPMQAPPRPYAPEAMGSLHGPIQMSSPNELRAQPNTSGSLVEARVQSGPQNIAANSNGAQGPQNISGIYFQQSPGVPKRISGPQVLPGVGNNAVSLQQPLNDVASNQNLAIGANLEQNQSGPSQNAQGPQVTAHGANFDGQSPSQNEQNSGSQDIAASQTIAEAPPAQSLANSEQLLTEQNQPNLGPRDPMASQIAPQTPPTLQNFSVPTTPNMHHRQNQSMLAAPKLQDLLPMKPAPFPKIATPWRHKMESMDIETNPFEPTTAPTALPTPAPEASLAPEVPTTTSPTLPLHILPTSSFHSSGANPDAAPATNLFRYPDQVKIPFFGAKAEDSQDLETLGPMRPTTPAPFRSEEIQNLEDVDVGEQKKEVEASDDEDVADSEDVKDMEAEADLTETEEEEMEEDVDEITASEKEITTTPGGIENNPDYLEDTFSQESELTSSNSESGTSSEKVPESFGIGKAPEFEEIPDGLAENPHKKPKAFGSLPSSSGPVDSGFGGFGSPPGASLSSFGSKKGPDSDPFGSPPGSKSSENTGFGSDPFGSPPGAFSSSETGSFGNKKGPSDFGPSAPTGNPSGSKSAISNFDSALSKATGSAGISKPSSAPSSQESAISQLSELVDEPSAPSDSSGSFGSASDSAGSAGSAPSSLGSGPSVPSGLSGLSGPFAPSGPSGPSGLFGIGRSPPGFSQPTGPTLPPAIRPQKPSFPTLLENQVENFFNDEIDDVDTGASSALGSFASAEVVADVPVSQNIQVIDPLRPPTPRPIQPVHMPTSRNPVGIFGTKLQTINQKAYKPPMFPGALSSETVKMVQLGNPYMERTTVQPIGPHGLADPLELNSVDLELPAWNGIEKDHGIMNKARRQYQKEFEQQTRDVRMIDEEINRISKINDDGRSKSSQRCSQVYAHTLSLPQIQKMSQSLGLGDVASVVQKAADLTENRENDIAQLELDLEEKRKLIAKVEILLSLAESRALLFDLLNEQKKIAEKMENRALDLLQKTNFHPHTPSPFSAASDLSELSSAVRQVMNANTAASSKKGWSLMKRKLHKKSKTPKKFEVIDPNDVVIKNSFMEFNKKAGHLQETAEIVEPVLSLPFVVQNDQFGRQPVAVAAHRRPLPLAPPTMTPIVLVRKPRPSQRAAHHLSGIKPLNPPSETESVHELIDMLHEDIVKLPAEEEEKICRQVQCDFEKADLCNFESSHDETTRLRLMNRQKRSPLTDDLLAEPSNIADDLLPYTFRAWSIWAGRRAERTKQIDIGPVFSPRNHHFAAVFLEPQQAGILSIPLILSPTSTKIRFRLFEGTRGIRLRICCDRYCPLETEQGLYRGHRSWLKKTVTCPANTQMLSFECLNEGPDRGACGIDDIFVDSNGCNHFFNGSDQS